VCNYISEVVDNLGQHVYFCPIGREEWSITHVIPLDIETLESRVLYSCDDTVLNHVILQHVSYYLYGQKLYFFSFSDGDRDYEYSAVMPTRTIQGVLKFRKKLNYGPDHNVLRMIPGKANHTVYIFHAGKDFSYVGKVGQTASEVAKKLYPNVWCNQLEYYLRKTMKAEEYTKLYDAREDIQKWEKVAGGRLKRKKK